MHTEKCTDYHSITFTSLTKINNQKPIKFKKHDILQQHINAVAEYQNARTLQTISQQIENFEVSP